MTSRIVFHMRRQLYTQNLHCKYVNKAKKVTFLLTRANSFNLSDPTVVLYGRAGGGLEISKRNRGIPPLVLAIPRILLGPES